MKEEQSRRISDSLPAVKDNYFLTIDAVIINTKSNTSKAVRQTYCLPGKGKGQYINITAKNLYQTVWGKDAHIDRIKYLPGEICKDIYGFDGLYQVSNMGRVFSLQSLEKIELTQQLDRHGYYAVILRKNNHSYRRLVHDLVCEAFCEIPNTTKELVVHHKDFDTKNNQSSNLVCITQQEHIELHRKERINRGNRN